MSLVSNAQGTLVSEQRYYPYGETRYAAGSLPTDLTFTDQREEMGLGLMDFKARMYSPLLGRFVSADTVVPDPPNPQVLNRYSYAANNPVKFIDPNGHQIEPPENCGALCYTGTLGPYNNKIDTSWMMASPAAQPLTTGSYHSTSDTYISAANIPADAGMLLTYEIAGYLRRREELLVCSADIEYGVGKVGAEFKNVKVYDGLFSNRKIEEHEEWSVPVGLGLAAPVVGGGTVGLDFNTQDIGVPYAEVDVFGAELTLQPGELMLRGKLTPFGGPGAAVGAEWQRGGYKYRILTSYEYYQEAGSDVIGERYASGGVLIDTLIDLRGLGILRLALSDPSWKGYWQEVP